MSRSQTINRMSLRSSPRKRYGMQARGVSCEGARHKVPSPTRGEGTLWRSSAHLQRAIRVCASTIGSRGTDSKQDTDQLMSAYQINKLCHRVFHDVAFREAVKRDPAAAIADWPFTEAERKALMEGDIRRLYEWGTHPFLLAHFTRWGLFGLTPAMYAERIQGARDPD